MQKTSWIAIGSLMLLPLLGGCAGTQETSTTTDTAEPAATETAATPAATETETAPAPSGPAWKAPSGWFYKQSFGKGEFAHLPVCVAADADRVAVVDSIGTETDTDTQVVIFNADGSVAAKVAVPLGTTKMRSHGIALGPDGAFYLALNAMEGEEQVAKVGRISGSGGSYSFEDLGRAGSAIAAYGIAVDRGGKVHLADAGTNQIWLDATGAANPIAGPGDTQDYPTRGLAAEPGGTLLTHTMKGDAFHLVRYGADGSKLKDVTVAGVAERLPWHYNEIDVAPDGTIFVADYGNKKIVVLNADGSSNAAIGCDACRGPVGISVSPTGHLYIADFRSKEVHVFDPMF